MQHMVSSNKPEGRPVPHDHNQDEDERHPCNPLRWTLAVWTLLGFIFVPFVTLAITYPISVANDTLNYPHFYISSAINYAPASMIGALGFFISAVFLGGAVTIRYYQVLTLNAHLKSVHDEALAKSSSARAAPAKRLSLAIVPHSNGELESDCVETRPPAPAVTATAEAENETAVKKATEEEAPAKPDSTSQSSRSNSASAESDTDPTDCTHEVAIEMNDLKAAKQQHQRTKPAKSCSGHKTAGDWDPSQFLTAAEVERLSTLLGRNNLWSLICGNFCALCFAAVGAFPYHQSSQAHDFWAGMYFISGMIWFMSQSRMTWILAKLTDENLTSADAPLSHLIDHRRQKTLALWRTVLTVVMSVLFVFMQTAIFVWRRPEIGSTLELIIAFFWTIYDFTLIPEFSRIRSTFAVNLGPHAPRIKSV